MVLSVLTTLPLTTNCKVKSPKSLGFCFFTWILSEIGFPSIVKLWLPVLLNKSSPVNVLMVMSEPLRFLLARITNYIEENSKIESKFDKYIQRSIKDPFEVEHIIPDVFSEYGGDFFDVKEFEEFRNRVGNLLLLPSSFNKSFGAKSFDIKVEHYFGQNLLAQSLNGKCYDHNPSFKKFVYESQLPFKPFSKFSKDEINQRQHLYKKIVEKIWDLKNLDEI